MDRNEIILLVGVCLLVFCTLVAGIFATWKVADYLSAQTSPLTPDTEDTGTTTKPSHSVKLQAPELKRVRFASTVQVC